MAKKVIKKPANSTDSPLKSNPQMILPWVLIIPVLMILGLYFYNVLDPTLMPKYMGIMGFVLIFFFYKGVVKNNLPLIDTIKNDRFWWVYLAFLFFTALSISGSALLGDGLFEWAKYLMGFGLIFLWVLSYSKTENEQSVRRDFSRVITAMALFAGLIGLYQFTDVLIQSGFQHDKLYQVSGFFAHRNIYCESLFLCLPFSFYSAMYDRNAVFRRIAYGITFVLLLLCLALLSRAVWIALGGSFLLITVFFILMEYPLWKKDEELKKKEVSLLLKIGLLGLVSIGVVLIYGYITNKATISGFIDSITQVNYYQNWDRMQKWRDSYTLFKENPWLGIGIGDWKIDILRFPPKNSVAEAGFLFFQRPHNDYLWVLSESGIFAFMAYCGLFFSALFKVARRLRQPADNEKRYYLYLLTAGLLGYMIFSFFSFSKERIEEVVLLSVIFAAILLESRSLPQTKTSAQPADRGLGVVLTALFALLFYVGYTRMEGEMILVKFQDSNERNNIKESIRLAEKAYRPLYQMDPVSAPIRFFSGTGYLKLKDFKTATKHLEEAYALSPYHVQVMNNLAGCYYTFGEVDKAEKMYKEASELAPKYTDVLLSYGVVVFNKKGAENEQNGFVITAKVDTLETRENYKTQLRTMADKITADILNKTPDSLLRNEVARIMKNEREYIPIARRSSGKRLFAVQLYAEALYKLYTQQKISEAEHEALKIKYNCDLLNQNTEKNNIQISLP